jgi:SARP family transcriptional regulator, regulator of embCAB operon
VEFRLLGPLEVRTDDGRTMEVAGAHQRALLATLLLNGGRTVSTKALITELWDADKPGDPQGALYAHLSRLRHSLAAWRLGRPSGLVTKQDGYQFWMGGDELDVTGFREMRSLGASTARSQPMAAAVVLRQALGIWRGAALQDAAHGPVCRAAAARLEQERMEAYELLIDSELAVGRPAVVIGELKELLTTQPLHEGLYLRLMTALQMSNRVGEALAVYQQARRVLTEQLGVEPSPVLQRCLQSLLGEQRSYSADGDVTPTWITPPKHAPSRFLLPAA